MDVLALLSEITFILALGVIMRTVCGKIKIPYIVFLLIGGTALNHFGLINLSLWENIPELIRTIALIIIAYSSGFYIKINEVKLLSKPILMLATVGVLLSTLIIFGATYWFLSIPLISAALLGALWSGSDPASIASSIKKSKLSTVLMSESILNSPITVILPFFVLDYLYKVNTSIAPVFLVELLPGKIIQLILLALMGILVGVGGYLVGKQLFRYSKDQSIEINLLVLVFAVYVASEFFGGSGILSVAITSVLISNQEFPEKKFLGKFNEDLAFIVTIFVFVLLGAEFTFNSFSMITTSEIVGVLVALFLGRIIATLAVLWNTTDLSLSEKIKLGLISPKGMAAAALAPLILSPVYGVLYPEKIVVITYLGIIFSIFISLVVLNVFTEKEKIVKGKVKLLDD